MISTHLKSWLGLPVHPLSFESLDKPIPDLSRTLCRLHVGWDDTGSFAELFERFLSLPGAERAPALIIGAFAGEDTSNDTGEIVQLLVNAHDRLPALRGIFLADIISEENEISWIEQSDVSPLFSAFPRLEHFAVRGGNSLSLGTINHESLRSLVVQSGGLPRTVLAEIARSRLPQLEHLEIWLGDDSYGWDGTVDDLRPLLDPQRFPNLRRLGLCNSVIEDEIAALVATAPIVDQLEILDLSRGSLSDTGGNALLAAGARLARLEKLDLHHHFLSEGMQKKVLAAFPRADVSDRQEGDEDGDVVYRPISAAE